MISIISSIQKSNRGLGFENDLLFKIPEDLRRFRDLTMGHPVIMGRRTWESLPVKFRPLPGRTNIVITSQEVGTGPEVIICKSVRDAVEAAKKLDSEVAIIGGAMVFREALPYADQLLLTEIEGNKASDTFFPEFEKDFILEKNDGPFETTEGVKYWFNDYKRK